MRFLQRLFVQTFALVFPIGCAPQAGCANTSCQACKTAQEVMAIEAEIGKSNLERQQYAFDHYPSAVPLTWFEPIRVRGGTTPSNSPTMEVPPAEAIAKPPERGLLREAGESLLLAPDKKSLIFVYTTCASHSGCGCVVPREYRFAKTNEGRVVILRSMPNASNAEEVYQCGSCGVGCGQPMPPELPSQAVLPVSDPAQVDVVGVPVDWKLFRMRCDDEMPRP